MRLVFTELGWSDYIWFQENNTKLVSRINSLIKNAMRTPFDGIGNPKPLKADLSGFWSRRINLEHRLVYKVSKEEITIIACRFHYQ
jgi:toxin YoeB